MTAENTTASPWLLPWPSPVGKVKLGSVDFQELAERTTTIFKERLITIAEHGSSFTAASGELVKCTAGITVTLPSPTANATVGVLANNYSSEITAGSAKIYGDFVEGATKVKLVGYQHLLLQSDGTNWFIIAGEPKREATYAVRVTHTKAAMEAGWVPSATRDAFVLFCTALPESEIGGEEIDVEESGLLKKEIKPGMALLIPAGQAIKGTSALTAQVLLR